MVIEEKSVAEIRRSMELHRCVVLANVLDSDQRLFQACGGGTCDGSNDRTAVVAIRSFMAG